MDGSLTATATATPTPRPAAGPSARDALARAATRNSTPLPRDGADGKPSLARQILQFGPDIFIGGAEAAWDMAKGIGTLVVHPIRTARGIWTLATKLVSEPVPTLRAIGAALVDPYLTAFKTGHPGKALGRGIVEIGSLFVTPADVVNVARGGRAFFGTAVAGLSAGEGAGRTLSAAAKAAKFSVKATGAARDAQMLAKLGHADEALKMAEMAGDSLLVTKLARGGQFGAMDAAVKALDLARPVTLAGKTYSLAGFLSHSSKLLGIRRFGIVSGHLSRDVYKIAAEAEKAHSAVRLAEHILAAGAKEPGLFNRLGRLALRNPQIFAPFTPTLGKVPDVLGKIDSLPTDLPAREGLTPQAAQEIAFKYNLEPSVENVRAFISEVSGYAESTIGPDTGTADSIKQLQVLLRQARFDVSVTGVWDRTTANAVVAFKRERHIKQGYRLANGEFAINEYADTNVVNMLLSVIDEQGQHKPKKAG